MQYITDPSFFDTNKTDNYQGLQKGSMTPVFNNLSMSFPTTPLFTNSNVLVLCFIGE